MSMYVWFHTTQNLENLKNGAKYISMYVWFHTKQTLENLKNQA